MSRERKSERRGATAAEAARTAPALPRQPDRSGTGDGARPLLLLYCRPGFEDECAREIVARVRLLGVPGHARTKPSSGFVEYEIDDPSDGPVIATSLRWRDLVFARQLLFGVGWHRALASGDRIGALLPLIEHAGGPFSKVWLETADTNEAKELAGFCRKFRAPLETTLSQRKLLDPADGRKPRLHVFFTDSTSACVATTSVENASPWPMGIPRLSMPGAAPSRSTQKLAEALQHWLPGEADAQVLHEGVTAVDLGAAPGGWTWQLARRGVHVTAVDNGPLDARLLRTGLVEHVRADGFRYSPPRPVAWMVCDIVEQPKRVAALVAEWLARGWCERSIFNLKLPMKQRHAEFERCRALILARCAAAGVRWRLEFRQLYHDREEVTGYAERAQRVATRGTARRKAPRPRYDQAE